ncbi:DUF3144 domain-containing protein [Poseidonibacter lekithochrous]|uniref:DUF3144 domain-containing protein n=1 Tax=Poseidonibacter lekithochrous TaxID=1904463 RepID=UPI000D384244|nr:DUF3144 domain-containing protein [Poseidonibacter lekithochrous]
MENQEEFLKRADAHIFLANEQINEEVTSGEVSASFMYGMTRFNAWIAACEFESAEDMSTEKEKVIEYFSSQYKNMLEEHINNHIEHFDFKK